MTIDGEAAILARALGHELGDPELLEAMALVGMPTSSEEFVLGPMTRTYYRSDGNAVDFLIEDGKLESVIVLTQALDDSRAYERADHLVEGLSATATRDEVRALLGEPEWTSDDPSEDADQFAVDGYFQHFIFENGRVARVTLMRSDPADW